jgi:methyl-accepting chemotaxis protein
MSVQMNVAEGNNFIAELNSRNETLWDVLKGVNQSVEEISNSAQGGVVGQLVNAYNSMCESTTKLVQSFTGLAEAVTGVLQAATGLAETISDLINPLGKLFG